MHSIPPPVIPQEFDLDITTANVKMGLGKLIENSLVQYLLFVMVRVFANSPGDLGSIPCRVIPKTQKMVLDATLLNTQHYKVRIKGKVE